ncbi:response regulator [Tropicimonas sp.]|uniref:response regulator n=1 Tax=Tropicimonas sp. TaxID=2067044 RepID=UPI003A8B6FC4
MADDLSRIMMTRRPTADRPLLGLTVLVVEDSRFACEALRLMCLRSGARIRRADCLASARRHLTLYMPTVVIVDFGLPDGTGTDLIGELALAEPRVPVLLGSSGDMAAEKPILTAGADGFLAKPVASVAAFQQAILAHLPAELRSFGPRPIPIDQVVPDRLALKDDLKHAARVLSGSKDNRTVKYVAQFLSSLATSSGDDGLARAATRFAAARPGSRETTRAISEINSMVVARQPGGPVF